MFVLSLYISIFEFVSDFDIRISSLCAFKAPSTPVENVLQISFFMQNKPNFMRFSPENDDLTTKQTQYKAKQSQFWANIKGGKAKQSQFKPNTKPIGERSKNEHKYLQHKGI